MVSFSVLGGHLARQHRLSPSTGQPPPLSRFDDSSARLAGMSTYMSLFARLLADEGVRDTSTSDSWDFRAQARPNVHKASRRSASIPIQPNTHMPITPLQAPSDRQLVFTSSQAARYVGARSRRSVAGPTPVTSTATGLPAASGASRATSSKTSSPRCRTPARSTTPRPRRSPEAPMTGASRRPRSLACE